MPVVVTVSKYVIQYTIIVRLMQATITNETMGNIPNFNRGTIPSDAKIISFRTQNPPKHYNFSYNRTMIWSEVGG